MIGSACTHKNFKVTANIMRLSHEEGGPVNGFSADVSVKCTDCGLPFRFVGLPAGSHFAEPRVSPDGLELRAPIEPATHEKWTTRRSYVTPPDPKKDRLQ